MKYTVSATDARIRFGEIMRRAKKGPVLIERAGKPEVVVLSKDHYDQLVRNAHRKDAQEALNQLHKRLLVELQGRTVPDSEEIIRKSRENRDE